MNQIFINATNREEIRVASVKNNKLVDLNIETPLKAKNKGNIYKGIITKIEASLEAAFVDYGKVKQGFLPFKEISTQYYQNNNTNDNEKISISDVLSEGQELIVQVEKEERGNKGASLTTFINLAGAYMVLIPNNSKSNGISRQINYKNRKELQEIIKQLNIPKEMGLIIRTAAQKKDLAELQWEVDYLIQLWRAIQNITNKDKQPFLIFQESNIVIQTIRDYMNYDTDNILIDDKELFVEAKDFVSFVLPHYLDKLKYFEAKEKQLFEYFNIEKQVKSVFNREVSLKSGATIVFDVTEALTSIDINSARATKGADIKETAFNTNIEAANEIANQLRLRDIGGLIVIDFIDMSAQEHKLEVEKAIQKATEKDRARVQIGNISQFGLLEMSRQRIKAPVYEYIQKACSQCNGSGTMPTISALSLDILRQIENESFVARDISQITIQSSVDVITYILNEKRSSILDLEKKNQIKIILLPNPYIKFPNYNINKQKKSKNKNHKSYQYMSKPQYNLLDTDIYEQNEEPAIKRNRPNTKIPRRKINIFNKVTNWLNVK